MIAERPTVPVCDEYHCITCGDAGDPMTVVKVDEDRGLALCQDEAGARHTVETALVEPVGPGDRILVHAGTAIASLAGALDPASTAAAAMPAAEEAEAARS